MEECIKLLNGLSEEELENLLQIIKEIRNNYSLEEINKMAS
ncbi:hypothetical protein [uncultured Tissierella sp.]|nr:hypothetical protein [uncultured Tissierella sp.]MDU5081998.1 hypothetical protein [Bacillota bacterium]